jgi:hypothetical protein
MTRRALSPTPCARAVRIGRSHAWLGDDGMTVADMTGVTPVTPPSGT